MTGPVSIPFLKARGVPRTDRRIRRNSRVRRNGATDFSGGRGLFPSAAGRIAPFFAAVPGMSFALSLHWRHVMRSGAHWLRPALALVVIAHGLAHAVLPMRGSMDPGNHVPVILYAVAVLGFTTAGVG